MSKKTYSDIDLPQALALTKRPDAVLVDVRENWEFEEFNEGGVNIPLAEIREKRPLVAPYQTIVVICTNGVRSKVAAMDYCRVPEWTDKQIYHVRGGIIESE
ncbi:rhodanese-related sulfurtransferase [Dyadobacter sp. BE34]|uniref:Rhodanese-related sulfurtransferase n=1 Tax=Dyadobacter fermentans TaxID=94254 RepID=A0ABU1QSJ3_9BACT|nr:MULTISPECIES: rhodanese-like domain-containing protein [Dyadobacter]MDR6804097.1 rhodanese-related sulfurtransferase [Dyadobacter fermentans]MDR7041837.1 rhodanese-related sulfurtransferase [Dyadobacter sp. BE242]MDR7196240.1 rhodanese-related sulfurtransferase [Dyadobacter sp. BE34]MDR7213215.1 rhodanese-related sulfurtransferase [Dyadobacter sp. BE31]MDR7261646.1 rhodanese-related sulfurtransferase [Dyadobacter sp. BE32]